MTLVGRVGLEPEVRLLPTGDRMATFSLATSEQWRDKVSNHNHNHKHEHKHTHKHKRKINTNTNACAAYSPARLEARCCTQAKRRPAEFAAGAEAQ